VQHLPPNLIQYLIIYRKPKTVKTNRYPHSRSYISSVSTRDITKCEIAGSQGGVRVGEDSGLLRCYTVSAVQFLPPSNTWALRNPYSWYSIEIDHGPVHAGLADVLFTGRQ